MSVPHPEYPYDDVQMYRIGVSGAAEFTATGDPSFAGTDPLSCPPQSFILANLLYSPAMVRDIEEQRCHHAHAFFGDRQQRMLIRAVLAAFGVRMRIQTVGSPRMSVKRRSQRACKVRQDMRGLAVLAVIDC